MRINLLIIMAVCITSSCGSEHTDQYVNSNASNAALKTIVPDTSRIIEGQRSIQDAISSELPRSTQLLTPIKIKRSHHSTNLLLPEMIDPTKNRHAETMYQLYFAEYISEKEKRKLKQKGLEDPNKYQLQVLFSTQNAAALANLEHHLSTTNLFSLFSDQHIRFAIIKNFIYHTPESQKINALDALLSIFSYLKEKKMDRHLVESKAIPIINAMFQLFKIPNTADIDLAEISEDLKDLFDRNYSLSLTVLLFEAIKEFYTKQYRQGKSMLGSRDILNPILLFLAPYLNQMCSLHFFSATEIMIPIMDSLLDLTENTHKDDIVFTVIQIFQHLEEKRANIINAQTVKEVRSIIKSTTDLFDIPNMTALGLSKLFIDLHYTNINIDMTVFLLEIVKEFVNTRYKEALETSQSFDIYQCRDKLATVTQHMKEHFFFTGRIVNHKLTKAYILELLRELNIPECSDIDMTLWRLFPPPIHPAFFPLEFKGSSTNTNDLGRDTPLPFALDIQPHHATSGLTAEQAIEKQRANLVARGSIVGSEPMPQALFSAESSKPAYKSAPSQE